MKRINMVFDNEYESADILLVPDQIADEIEKVVWDFNIWLKNPEHAQRFMITGADNKIYLNINTEDFIWWLNNIRIVDDNKAQLEQQFVPYVPAYPIAEF